MESWIFLAIILVIALIGKNQSLIIATLVVMGLKCFPFASRYMEIIHSKGINWGVTIISVAILIPIATEEITLTDLWHVFKTPAGWIAVFFGVAVAILSKYGVSQLSATPEVTVALVFGTIMGVVLFKGIAAGPIIASGMTYLVVSLLGLSFK